MKNEVINLNIIGKGNDVEKIQKRLRCAARATGTELHLSWQHEYPQTLDIAAENSVAVTCEKKLLLDGPGTTEEIETLLTRLKNNR